MTKLAVGIIGYGRIGNEHAGWLAQCDTIHATAVADPTPARREKAAQRGLKTYENPEQLHNDPTIDAILISTPTAMHCPQALAALAAGKHVMIEKPMALDLNESKKIADEAKRKNKILSVFHNRRWDLDYLTVKSAIDANLFGKIINIESRLGQWSSCVGPAAKEYRPGWRNEAAFGGGALYDWGSHFIDQLWRLMLPAKPTQLFAQLRGNVWSHDCDDFARILINFDNGSAGLVEINTTTTKPLPRWHIDGTLGSAQSPHSLDFNLQTWAKLDFHPATKPTALPWVPPTIKALTEPQIWAQFAAAITGHIPPAVTVESVLPTMQLLDATRESSRLGTSINLHL